MVWPPDLRGPVFDPLAARAKHAGGDVLRYARAAKAGADQEHRRLQLRSAPLGRPVVG